MEDRRFSELARQHLNIGPDDRVHIAIFADNMIGVGAETENGARLDVAGDQVAFTALIELHAVKIEGHGTPVEVFTILECRTEFDAARIERHHLRLDFLADDDAVGCLGEAVGGVNQVGARVEPEFGITALRRCNKLQAPVGIGRFRIDPPDEPFVQRRAVGRQLCHQVESALPQAALDAGG